MNRFAFIIHPIEVADIARKYPIAAKLPDPLVEWATAKFITPKFVSRIKGIRSKATGEEVEGMFIAAPLTTRLLLEWPAERTVPVIIECAKMAEAEGAQIVGLGAMSSVVGDAGISVDQAVDIAVTTGNSYTVATALEGSRKAAEMMGVDLAHADVAVIGATGAIGRVCAEMMTGSVGQVTLCVRDQAKGEALAEELRAKSSSTIRVSTELDQVLPEADIVVCVSAAVETLVEPRHLKPGAVVCDVARPRDVSTAVADERDDVLVIEGGVVKPPGDVDFGMNFGFPPGLCYACMAETALLAVAGKFESYSLGRHLEREKVEAISELAAHHGFELAGFRSFERAMDAAGIEEIRQRAEGRRAAVG